MNRYDLTTLAHVKGWLTIPDSDTAADVNLTRMISAQGRAFQNILSRMIVAQEYIEHRDGIGMGGGKSKMLFNNYPVLSVALVTIGANVLPASPDNGLTQYGYGFDQRALWVDPVSVGFVRGVRNVRLQYTAGFAYPGYDNLDTYWPAEAATIPASGAYTVSTLATWLKDLGVAFTGGAVLTAVASSPLAGQYTVTNGVYTFNSADASKAILISYSYVPEDLEQACIEMIGVRFKEKDRIGQMSKSVGTETISFTQKDLTDSALLVVNQYRKVFAF